MIVPTYYEKHVSNFEEPIDAKSGLPNGTMVLMFRDACNFQCQYCFFHDLGIVKRSKSPTLAEMIASLDDEQLHIKRVVFTGLECTQFADLPLVAKAFKDAGKEVHVHTNGTNPTMLKKMLDSGVVDFVAMDIKATPEKYKLVTGVDFDYPIIRKSIDLLMKYPGRYMFRTAICRELLTKEDVVEIAKAINGADWYEVKGYFDTPRARSAGKLTAYTSKEMQEIEDAIKPYVNKSSLREGRKSLESV